MLKYMKDYDFDLTYHSDKANVVVDALIKRSYLTNMIAAREWKLFEDGSDAVFWVLRQEGSTFMTSLSIMS